MQKYLDNIGDVRENKQDIQTSMAVYIQNIRGKEERVRLVNRDPDNLLVSWIPSGECPRS